MRAHYRAWTHAAYTASAFLRLKVELTWVNYCRARIPTIQERHLLPRQTRLENLVSCPLSGGKGVRVFHGAIPRIGIEISDAVEPAKQRVQIGFLEPTRYIAIFFPDYRHPLLSPSH